MRLAEDSPPEGMAETATANETKVRMVGKCMALLGRGKVSPIEWDQVCVSIEVNVCRIIYSRIGYFYL